MKTKLTDYQAFVLAQALIADAAGYGMIYRDIDDQMHLTMHYKGTGESFRSMKAALAKAGA